MQPPAGARRTRRKVGRPQDAGIALEVRDDLALVPDVIAGGQDVDAAIIELAA